MEVEGRVRSCDTHHARMVSLGYRYRHGKADYRHAKSI